MRPSPSPPRQRSRARSPVASPVSARPKRRKDFTSYRIVVEAHIARLGLTRTSRIYQQQSAPQIIEAILRRHDFKGHQFSFKLRRKYPQHAFRFQYQIADWPYIHVLMEQEGIYSYIVPGKFGDVVCSPTTSITTCISLN
jgi:type VI secretion system secreted protein VgrG